MLGEKYDIELDIFVKGGDSVMACKLNGGSVTFELGYNSDTGKSYSPLPDVSNIKNFY